MDTRRKRAQREIKEEGLGKVMFTIREYTATNPTARTSLTANETIIDCGAEEDDTRSRYEEGTGFGQAFFDLENAFNNVSRYQMLGNIAHLCGTRQAALCSTNVSIGTLHSYGTDLGTQSLQLIPRKELHNDAS